MTRPNRKRRLLRAAVLAVATAFAAVAAHPQNPAAATSQNSAPPKRLEITILEGEGALNNIRERTAREPIVQVRDENHKPVAGAAVLFAIESNGGGQLNATFAGSQTLSTVTDAQGQAIGHGFQITRVPGKFNIRVRAQSGEAQAEQVISETNLLNTASSSAGHTAAAVHGGIFGAHTTAVLITVGVVAVAGLTTGVILATRSSPVSVTPGTGTVGPPAAAVAPGLRFTFGKNGR